MNPIFPIESCEAMQGMAMFFTIVWSIMSYTFWARV